MHCLILNVFRVIRQFLKSLLKVFIFFFFAIVCFINPISTEAILETYQDNDGTKVQRSLESLRDLDYQTWQLSAYPKPANNGQMVLRIVGFKGSLRIDHPTELEVFSGIKAWKLEDITLSNPKLTNDYRDAVAEFSLETLLEDLSNNRPLRLSLDGGFAELPVPPYVVNEWRSINSNSLKDEN